MAKTTTVAYFINESIRKCGKTHRQITGEVGFISLDMIPSIAKGTEKVPLHKVGPIADAIGVDPLYLFSLVMQEDFPETYDSLCPILKGLELTEEEMRFLRTFRKMQEEEKRVIKN
jgi:hypothetical protein